MRVENAIKELMKTVHIKPVELARRLGVTAQTINGRLNRPGMHTETTVQMANALNYRLVLIPDTAKLPEGSVEVTE